MALEQATTGVIDVTVSHEVGALADRVLDPNRDVPLVCVTAARQAEPFVDPVALKDALGARADVYAMLDAKLPWELSERLPANMSVYGGAVRVWWPLGDGELRPSDHPVLATYSPDAADKTISEVVEKFAARARADAPLPTVGDELRAVVRAVEGSGAKVLLATGREAFIHRSKLSTAGLPTRRLVRPGQALRVRVQRVSATSIQASALPFEPDRWQRLRDELKPGDVVTGVVTQMRNFGVFVELLPGALGLLPKGRISHDWISHPEDVLELGERVDVRVLSVSRSEEKAELSLRGDVSQPRVLAVYPDGPPWLDPDAPRDPEPVAEQPQGEPAEQPAPSPPEQPAPTPPEQPAPTPPEQPAPAEQPAPSPPPPDPDHDAPAPAAGDTAKQAEVEALERAIDAGSDLQQRLAEIETRTERRLARLRADARQLTAALESDLVAIRARILELAEAEAETLIGSTEKELASAREQVAQLRADLQAAGREREQLISQLAEQKQRAEAAQRRAARAEQRLRARTEELARADLNSDTQLVQRIRATWEHLTPAQSDRERYTWREVTIGEGFSDSLASVQGVPLQRIFDACAHVVSRRAAEVPSLELHQLRTGTGGNDPQRQREDGAKAWRCSLQAKAAAARRLHYWELPDGAVELAKVVYHDDYSI